MKILSSIALGLLPHRVHMDYMICPLLGPDYPPPRELPNSKIWRNTVRSTTETIQTAINLNLFNSANLSFALEIFSVHQADPVYEFYHTAPLLASPPGTNEVDSNSIFRIGSITKLFTVYTMLIEVGDAHFTDPVTKWVPELKTEMNRDQDPVNKIDWDSVTLGSLASQISGVGRDCDLALQFPNGSDFPAFGLPPLTKDEVPPCGTQPLCTRKQFFAGLIRRHPVHAPFVSPTYSNVAFQILAYALEGITGRTFVDMLESDIIKRLQLNGSSYKTPRDVSRGVIPEPINLSAWDFDLGEEGPAGSIYSTTSDMSTLGRSILSSRLLTSEQTHRWLKPTSFTSALRSAVGAPWEIYRMQLTKPSKIVDAYTKGGGIGLYSSELVLIPELDLGLIVLCAGALEGAPVLAELIADAFIPVAEAVAREEADNNYVGRYLAADMTKLNSSIEIATEIVRPGLEIKSWISNGTDVFTTYGNVALGLPRNKVSIRLYPTGLVTPLGEGGEEVAWRAVMEPKMENAGSAGTNLFIGNCLSWVGVDAYRYGSVALDEFLFVVGKDGKATSVEPRALRVRLEKQ